MGSLFWIAVHKFYLITNLSGLKFILVEMCSSPLILDYDFLCARKLVCDWKMDFQAAKLTLKAEISDDQAKDISF